MLKNKDFWIGVLAGYLLLSFVPALNFRAKLGGQ